MSNISRRQFLKSAGVATLAVAAAGVLAGCSKEDIPQVPEVTTDIVTVYFFDKTLDNGKGGGIGDTYKMEVLKGDPLDPTKIPPEAFPKGYVLESEAPVKVEDDGNGKKLALVPVKQHKDVVTSTKYVKVTFQNCDTGKIVEKQIKVAEDAKKIYAKDLTLPEGWALADGNENWSSDLKLGEGADAGLDVAILPCLCKNA